MLIDEEYSYWLKKTDAYLGRRIWISIALSKWNTWDFGLKLRLRRCNAHRLSIQFFGYDFHVTVFYM